MQLPIQIFARLRLLKEEWNKMCEEFILKACKLFRWRVDTKNKKIKKNGSNVKKIYCFVFIFLFCCLFFKNKY